MTGTRFNEVLAAAVGFGTYLDEYSTIKLTTSFSNAGGDDVRYGLAYDRVMPLKHWWMSFSVSGDTSGNGLGKNTARSAGSELYFYPDQAFGFGVFGSILDPGANIGALKTGGVGMSYHLNPKTQFVSSWSFSDQERIEISEFAVGFSLFF